MPTYWTFLTKRFDRLFVLRPFSFKKRGVVYVLFAFAKRTKRTVLMLLFRLYEKVTKKYTRGQQTSGLRGAVQSSTQAYFL